MGRGQIQRGGKPTAPPWGITAPLPGRKRGIRSMNAPWPTLIVRSCPHQAPASRPCDASLGMGEPAKTQQQLGVLGCPSCVWSWPTGKVPPSVGQGPTSQTAALQSYSCTGGRQGTPWGRGPACAAAGAGSAPRAGFVLGMLKVAPRAGDRQPGELCAAGWRERPGSPGRAEPQAAASAGQGRGAVQGQHGGDVAAQGQRRGRRAARGTAGRLARWRRGSLGAARGERGIRGWLEGGGGTRAAAGTLRGCPVLIPPPGPGGTRRRSRGAI